MIWDFITNAPIIIVHEPSQIQQVTHFDSPSFGKSSARFECELIVGSLVSP